MKTLLRISSIVWIFIFTGLTVYSGNPIKNKVLKVLQNKVLANANWALTQDPVTVTAVHAERSAGGIHDYFSEGDFVLAILTKHCKQTQSLVFIFNASRCSADNITALQSQFFISKVLHTKVLPHNAQVLLRGVIGNYKFTHYCLMVNHHFYMINTII